MLAPEIEKKLPELIDILRVVKKLGSHARVEVVKHVRYAGLEFPIHAIVLGSENPEAPSVGFYGGVHGLERIGSKVVTSYLETIAELLVWDETLHHRLEHSRMVFMPLINPVGTYLKRRSNGRGVDLMRNSPVLAKGVPHFPMGGHRLTPRIPFFRGYLTDDLEEESQALIDVVTRFQFPSALSIAVDVHSGFGATDRLWVPYAKTIEPFPEFVEAYALKKLFDRTYSNHFYVFEPQARQYTTHGDLWDYMYDLSFHAQSGRYFLPITLEMGSWVWIKKNPRQIFNILGPFDPILPHRRQRILRRHLTMFDFMHRALQSPQAWLKHSKAERRTLEREALELWYARKNS